MTREQAKAILPIIQAYAEGKTIQYRTSNNKWIDTYKPSFSDSSSNYRIKPEQKYVPFINKEECWAEMHKHPDFGWVKDKDGKYINMLSVGKDQSFNFLFTLYTFTDGTPFGIKEE